MYAGKPILGLAGGIGSGKSTVARLLAELGCFVIDSDDLTKQAHLRPDVIRMVQEWWGKETILPDGRIDRKAVARRVFSDEKERQKLEGLLHPIVNQARDEAMTRAIAQNPQFPAFVWDSPLLFETGQHLRCDALIFVEAPLQQRLARLRESRGWDQQELAKREKLQWPLDKKREISDYVIVNTADADYARSQIKEVLSRTLASMKSKR
ncbi:MAG: dephospho-CoA kinase [Tepidisphaeraceae bacterium]